MVITGSTYDTMKKLVQIILPAVSSLYFGLAAIWGLPAAEQVVGTIAVLTTFLGVCLGISSKNYTDRELGIDGHMIVTESEDGPTKFLLELDGDPAEMVNKDSITFKVNSPTKND